MDTDKIAQLICDKTTQFDNDNESGIILYADEFIDALADYFAGTVCECGRDNWSELDTYVAPQGYYCLHCGDYRAEFDRIAKGE